MDIRNIHSIWVEDEQSSKFHLNDPNLKILNSQVPLLSSKENIELPPLPPSSFFSYSLKDEDESAKSSNKLHKMFKKFGLNNDQSKAPVKKVKRKISTPFGFNHVSHIDNKPGATITVNQLSEIQPQEQDELDEPSQSNRTSTSAKAFCTSPQINTTTTTLQSKSQDQFQMQLHYQELHLLNYLQDLHQFPQWPPQFHLKPIQRKIQSYQLQININIKIHQVQLKI
ncbi:unnamed protein product [Wickerhamomyces anomalus]